jgi:hypothetical protein
MDPQKKENDAMGAAFVGLGFALLIMFIVAALVSLFITFVCISAWKKERVIFGHTITPFEARCFIGFGLFGGLVGFIFGIIMLVNHMGPETDIFMWPIIGYVLGSLGWAIAYASNQKHVTPPVASVPPTPLQSAPPPRHAPRAEFEFASWNDEESNR